MDRLKEGSTWAGFGVLFQVLKAFLPPQHAIYVDALSAGAAAIAGMLPDRPKAA